MRERPILFSTEMVRAILDGRKTQTRRVMTPQPEYDPGRRYLIWLKNGLRQGSPIKYAGWWFDSPYGQPGDLLWVRETWAVSSVWGNTKPSDLPTNGAAVFYFDEGFGDYKKRPSIHMPRWASRITLEVMNVRVERVQDISEADAIAEGVTGLDENDKLPAHRRLYTDYSDKIDDSVRAFVTAKGSFSTLWDSINAKRTMIHEYEDDDGTMHREEVSGGYSWASNPWVWVIEFEVRR